MSAFVVQIVNASTIFPKDHTRALADALSFQAANDFRPAWAIEGFAVTDDMGLDADVDGTLLIEDEPGPNIPKDWGGYHTDEHGRPASRVFASVAKAGGRYLSEMASHEFLEILANPAVNRYAMDAQSRLFSLEVCDPVNGRRYWSDFKYPGQGGFIALSDFVLPAWFNPNAAGPYTFLASKFGIGADEDLRIPFQLGTLGFSAYWQGGAYTPVYGANVQAQDQALPPWSRRAACRAACDGLAPMNPLAKLLREVLARRCFASKAL